MAQEKPSGEPWPLAPSGEAQDGDDLDAAEEARGFLRQFTRTALALLPIPLVGGVCTVVLFLSAITEVRGATRGMALKRDRQRLCMELGVTPEELDAALAARAAAAATSDGVSPGDPPRGPQVP